MKTSSKVVLLVLATVVVAGGTVHLFLPDGLPRTLDRAFAWSPKTPAQSAPRKSERPAAPNGASELRDAERAFDAGDFDEAINGFLAARADVDGDYRERAERGLRRSVLAWALTVNPAPVDPLPADPDAEIARRQELTEATPSEQAWYDLTVYAAGCGASRKLPFLQQQAIGCALRDGPVEKRLKKVLERAGSRTSILKEAMTASGLLDVEPVDPVAEAAAPRPKSGGGAAPAQWPAKSAITPPVGRFTPETKAKLEQAVDLEKKGVIEYDLSGPDAPDRKKHRKAALEFLKQARDLYQDAQEEDENSPSLGRRLQQVMEMISHLNKETSLGE
jgi:hypothetical protein